MIRSLFYLLKIILLVGSVSYLASLQGNVTLGWQDYRITMGMNLLAVMGFVGFLLLIALAGIVHDILAIPRRLARYRAQKRHERGYKFLLRGLTAAAVGDHKNARQLAFKSQKLLPEDESGLSLLLQAQAQRAMGNYEADAGQNIDIDQPFRMLLRNAETTLLGLQGLVQNAILSNDFEKALILARDVVKKYPKNYALLKTLYELEIRNHLWNDALVTLESAEKHKIIAAQNAKNDRTVLYIVLGDLAREAARLEEAEKSYKRAYKISPHFVPAILKLAEFYARHDKVKKAADLIQKSWKESPHPEFLKLWWQLRPAAGPAGLRAGGDARARDAKDSALKWMDKLTRLHDPNLFHALLYHAKAAIEDGLWGEARVSLGKCEKISQDASVFKLWVELEEKTSARADVIRQWLDRAAMAKPNYGWLYAKTHRLYEEWQAVIMPENDFNALIWTPPMDDGAGGANASTSANANASETEQRGISTVTLSQNPNSLAA